LTYLESTILVNYKSGVRVVTPVMKGPARKCVGFRGHS